MNVAQARSMAERAHQGQYDKAGMPYIEHVERVAAAVMGDEEAEMVAWLHDVWEDHPDFNEGHVPESLPVTLVDSIRRLNRRHASSEQAYYQAILACPLALRVKRADLADNANETRLALLDSETADRLRKKYANALSLLTV